MKRNVNMKEHQIMGNCAGTRNKHAKERNKEGRMEGIQVTKQ
jgi:hypothetical protein